MIQPVEFSELAVKNRNAADRMIASEVVRETLQGQREAISGVSIDEEAINMIRFQRAFQGAARFVSLVDEMLEELMRLV